MQFNSMDSKDLIKICIFVVLYKLANIATANDKIALEKKENSAYQSQALNLSISDLYICIK